MEKERWRKETNEYERRTMKNSNIVTCAGSLGRHKTQQQAKENNSEKKR